MIRRLRLEHFKSAREQCELEFAPLTLVAGPNSSGKSTLIQAILVLSQTASSTLGDRALVLNGPLVRLGAFDEVLSHGSDSKEIAIGVDLQIRTSASAAPRLRRISIGLQRTLMGLGRGMLTVGLDARFSRRRRLRAHTVESGRKLNPIRLEELQLVVSREKTAEAAGPMIRIARVKVSPEARAAQLSLTVDPTNSRDFQGLEYRVVINDYDLPLASGSARRLTTPPVGVLLNHFLPRYLLTKVDKRPELERALGDSLSSGHVDLEVGETGTEFWRIVRNAVAGLEATGASTFTGSSEEDWMDWVESLDKEGQVNVRRMLEVATSELVSLVSGSKGPIFSTELNLVPDPLRDAIDYADQFLATCIHHIGPIRNAPSSAHGFADSDGSTNVGSRGQHTAAVLHLHGETRVRAPMPPDSPARLADIPAREAVEVWLQYLGLGRRVRTQDVGSLGHSLLVEDEQGQEHDLTQVGVGLSQVLPIIVAGLLTSSGDVLIIEQPELHLHPLAQARLADFLLAVGQHGVQCIIESHSEHILNRIRLRVAQARPRGAETLMSTVRILWAGQSGGVTRYTPIQMNEFGSIPDWPHGFFDEAQSASQDIISAAIEKRRSFK